KTIVEKGSETTNNLVVSKRLFPLLMEVAPSPSPLYCGSAATDFGGFTSRFQTLKIGSSYAPPSPLGSTLDFGFSCAARDRFRIVLGMGILALCAALFVHYRVFA